MTNNQPYPYTGTENLLVIGIDVGTTFSGVSYALLEPGKVPRIQPVTRFSGQRVENGKSKIRSAVCYDRDGVAIAAGSETDFEENPILPEIEDVRRAECFKLRLCLSADKTRQLESIWPPLAHAEDESDSNVPFDIERAEGGRLEGSKEFKSGRGGSEEEVSCGTQIIERQHTRRNIPRPVTDDFKAPLGVYTDFVRYLFKSTKEYIIKTEKNLDPTFTWSSIEKNTYFVLTHPNGWAGKQQSQMREAAIGANLVNRATVTSKIAFVTEGEAGLHFCLDKHQELCQERGGLLVVDCGGGTIDLSTYLQVQEGHYKQIVSPYSLSQGSIFITSRARDHFKEKFKDSQFGSDSIVEAMARAFDKPEGIKCMFRYPNRPYFVKFGCLRDNDQECGVLGGKFKVEGAQMAKFFEPSIQGIINGIENQRRNSSKEGISIKHVLLIGGFGRSQYLHQKLSDYFDNSGLAILRPDITHLNKAVADGAVSWYLKRYVSTNSYRAMTRHLFDPTGPDRLKRESPAWTAANTAGNRGQAAYMKQESTLRRTNPFPQQVHPCKNGQKLSGMTKAADGRRETGDNSSQARRVNHWQERRDTGEMGTGLLNLDRQSRKGHKERSKAEEAVLNHHRGHNRGKDCHVNTKRKQLREPSSFTGKSDMISVADVEELVRMLNAQTGQSSFIPDSLSHQNSSISSKELEDVLDKFTSYIESSLCNELRSHLNNPNIAPDPLITQVALRSGLANACSYIISNGILSSDSATLSRAHGKRG